MSSSTGALRVCFALPHLVPGDQGIIVGGSANAALALAMALKKRGHSVDVVAPVPEASVSRLLLHPAHGIITPLIYKRTVPLGVVRGLTSLTVLNRALRRRSADWDILHSHSGTFPYALISAFSPRVPVRVHSLYCPISEVGGIHSSWWDHALVAKLAFRHLDAVLPATGNVYQSLLKCGIDERKLSLLTMCYDATRYSPRPRSASTRFFAPDASSLRIAFVGNASREKGLRVLCEALGILAKDGLHPQVVATLENAHNIAGYRSELDQITTRLLQLGVAKQVQFLGLVPDLADLYSESDVVIIPWLTTRGPSDYPMSAIEAMAMERCVIASPVGGIPELLRDGRAGLIARDASPESIASVVRRAISHPEERDALAKRGRLVAESHSSEALAEEVIELYGTLYHRRHNTQ